MYYHGLKNWVGQVEVDIKLMPQFYIVGVICHMLMHGCYININLDVIRSFRPFCQYVEAHLAGVCQTRLLLDLFGERDFPTSSTGSCCDVCSSQISGDTVYEDFHCELEVLIGCKGEVNVAEWIQGSKVSWTDVKDQCHNIILETIREWIYCFG